MIKAIKNENGEWVLEVLGVPFGGFNARDAHGEYFNADTQFHADRYSLPPVVYYHGLDENGYPSGDPQYIGKTTEREEKQDGIWYRVVLDKTNALALRVWEAAKEGIARASSGSNHLARVMPDGWIKEWPITELSIFDAVGHRQPANAYAIANVAKTKAIYRDAGIPVPDDIDPSVEADSSKADSKSAVATAPNGSTVIQPKTLENITMDPELVAAAVKAAMDKERKEAEEAKAEEAAEAARVEAAVKAARSEWESEIAAQNRLPSGSAPAVIDGETRKYDHLSAGDLALMIGVLDSSPAAFPSVAAYKALARRLEATEGNSTDYFAAARLAMTRSHIKANEISQSTLASYGDEWVGTAYGGELWQGIRHGTPVMERLMEYAVPQPAGAETFTNPVESTDPTWYKVNQATDLSANPGGIPTNTVTSSKVGTAKQDRTLGKIGARMLWTGELNEDSVIDYVSEIRRQLSESGAEVMESVVIDGDTDTSATTNINDIAGTPGGTEYWLTINGFRKLALVTNTANSRSAAAHTSADYIETVKLMGLAGKNAFDKSKVAFIVDANTNWKAVQLADVKTRDVNGNMTIETGILASVWGYDVIVTPNMHKPSTDATYGLRVNTAGKIDQDTASNNSTGAILAVRFDQWRFGYRRMMTLETVRHPAADATEIVAMARFGMVYRDTEASAISYNVTI